MAQEKYLQFRYQLILHAFLGCLNHLKLNQELFKRQDIFLIKQVQLQITQIQRVLSDSKYLLFY